MKGFKNLKIGVKISLIVSLVLFVGLITVMVVTISQVRHTTEVDTKNRLGEICNSRVYYVTEYIDQLCEYYAGLTSMPAIIEGLENPDDPQKIADMQETLERYISSRDDMEGIFVTNTETVILAHTVTSAIGAQISDDPAVWEDRKHRSHRCASERVPLELSRHVGERCCFLVAHHARHQQLVGIRQGHFGGKPLYERLLPRWTFQRYGYA